MGHTREAREWWNTARHVTDASGDLELGLKVRGERLIHGLYEHRSPHLLLRQIAEALEYANGHVCAGLAHVYTGQSQLLASIGDARAAENGLAQSRTVFERLPSNAKNNSGSMLNFGEDRIRYTEAWVYAYLGEQRKADQAARFAIELYPANITRPAAQIKMIQAFARIQAGDVTEGVRHAQATYEALPTNNRWTMIDTLATQILHAIPSGERKRPDVVAFNELVTAPNRKAIES
jgi:hypothetical protein